MSGGIGLGPLPSSPGQGRRVTWDEIVPGIEEMLNFLAKPTAVTTSQTLDSSAVVWWVDATAGAVTLTLPPVESGLRRYEIKKMDASANAVTIDGDGSETIDGATTLVLSSQYDAVRLVHDDTEWGVM